MKVAGSLCPLPAIFILEGEESQISGSSFSEQRVTRPGGVKPCLFG
jgi:hypothetical protein